MIPRGPLKAEKVINMTPQEFSDLQEAASECVDLDGRFSESEFSRRVALMFGVRYGHYRIVVRRDVPAIPWISKGVFRIENEYVSHD